METKMHNPEKTTRQPRTRAMPAVTQEKAAGQPTSPSRFEFKPEVLDRVGVSYVTIWQWMRTGTFPASREVGGKVAWLESDIDEWMLSRPLRNYKSRQLA